MQPVWYHAGRVHQLPNRLQHSLEVVLLRLPPHQHVEGGVDVLGALAGGVHVLPVLVAVQPDAETPVARGELWALLLPAKLFDDAAVLVQHAFNLFELVVVRELKKLTATLIDIGRTSTHLYTHKPTNTHTHTHILKMT